MFNRIRKIKEIKDKLNNMTFNKANENIKLFFDEYFRQQEIIQTKLKLSFNLEHEQEHNRIIEFKNDLDIIADKFNELLTEKSQLKLFKQLPSIMNKSGDMKKKYKIENCNIDNFKV